MAPMKPWLPCTACHAWLPLVSRTCSAAGLPCHGLTCLCMHSMPQSVVLQIEDMLKRSFAEFHAQRAQPEALRALEEGQARLAALQV